MLLAGRDAVGTHEGVSSSTIASLTPRARVAACSLSAGTPSVGASHDASRDSLLVRALLVEAAAAARVLSAAAILSAAPLLLSLPL